MPRIPLLVVAAVLLALCSVATSADAGGIGFRLAVINVDGMHRQRLMNDIQIELLDFSPDRRHVVYARGCGSFCKSGLYVSAPNETKAQRILATQAQIFPASWSPDGRRIAFGVLGRLNDVTTTTCGQSVWTIRSDGSDLHLVSDCALLARDSTNEQPWSPDSSRLVFLGNVHQAPGDTANLAVANSDGTDRRDFSLLHVSDAAWAPRGDRVAFATRPGGSGPLFRVGVIDVGNGSVTQVGPGSSPAWSHSGRQFAYVDGRGDYRSRAYVGKVTFGRSGPHRSRLRATYVVGGKLIAWSPNDHGLAFVGCRASRFCKQPEVFYVRNDGSGLHQITNEHDIATVEFEGVWWASSGRRLFFSRFRLGA